LNVLDLAAENFLITFAVVLGIGFLQGMIMCKGIRNRFPSIKKHAQLVSSVLLVLFSFNAIFSILKFAEPVKFSVSNFALPATTDEVFSLILNITGVNTGVGTVIAYSFLSR